MNKIQYAMLFVILGLLVIWAIPQQKKVTRMFQDGNGKIYHVVTHGYEIPQNEPFAFFLLRWTAWSNGDITVHWPILRIEFGTLIRKWDNERRAEKLAEYEKLHPQEVHNPEKTRLEVNWKSEVFHGPYYGEWTHFGENKSSKWTYRPEVNYGGYKEWTGRYEFEQTSRETKSLIRD